MFWVSPANRERFFLFLFLYSKLMGTSLHVLGYGLSYLLRSPDSLIFHWILRIRLSIYAQIGPWSAPLASWDFNLIVHLNHFRLLLLVPWGTHCFLASFQVESVLPLLHLFFLHMSRRRGHHFLALKCEEFSSVLQSLAPISSKEGKNAVLSASNLSNFWLWGWTDYWCCHLPSFSVPYTSHVGLETNKRSPIRQAIKTSPLNISVKA